MSRTQASAVISGQPLLSSVCNGMGDITALERMNYDHIVSSMSGDIDASLVPAWHQSKA